MAMVCPDSDGSLHMNLVCPVDVSKQPGGSLPDIQSAEYATALMKNISQPTRRSEAHEPFFLAVGFHKPHIPLKYPKEFLDLYPIADISPPSNPHLPSGLPAVAWEPWSDVRRREDVEALNISFPYGPMPADFSLRIRQSYYAATSYMDSLVGNLLNTLNETGMANRTIVVFLGDHGWQLGEHQEWAKYSTFEVAVRVPLLVLIPGLTDACLKAGLSSTPSSNLLVELVDLFPTLSDLVGISVPPLCPHNSSNVMLCTEGLSFAPILRNSSHTCTHEQLDSQTADRWKSAVFSQYPRPSDKPQNNSDLPDLKDIEIMGYSMRTLDYRYTEWVGFDPNTFEGNWKEVHARELYLHAAGDGEENNNVAGQSQFSPLVNQLSGKLKQGWRAALPEDKERRACS